MTRLLLGFILSLAFSQTLEEAKKAYDSKNYLAAFEVASELTRTSPQDFQAHFLLGLAATKLQNWDVAVTSFEAVLSLEKNHLPSCLQLAFLYEKKKDFSRARESWRRVSELAKDEKTKNIAQKHLNNLK